MAILPEENHLQDHFSCINVKLASKPLDVSWVLRGGIESVEAKARSNERHGADSDYRQLEDGPTQGLNAAKVVDARTRHSGVGLAQWLWMCMHCANCQLELIHDTSYLYKYRANGK